MNIIIYNLVPDHCVHYIQISAIKMSHKQI